MTVTTTQEAPVSMEEMMGAVMRLSSSLDVLAALGARAGTDGDAVPTDIAAAIDEVLAAAGMPSPDGLAPQQRMAVAGMIRTTFGQALDLLDRPSRPAGWSYADVAVLEGQGRGSMSVPPMMVATGEFGDVRSFLDVGTGVGWLAVAAAQVWPNAEVIGVDTWEPSLERAAQNVSASGLAERVEIRKQSAAELSDRDRFDLTWVPAFYLAADVLPGAFTSILAATRVGGRIAVGRFDAPPDPVALAAQRLRTLRDGGALPSVDETVTMLTNAGWSDVRALPRPPQVPLQFVVGTKP
jgi:SAM-dependent methyltransferase